MKTFSLACITALTLATEAEHDLFYDSFYAPVQNLGANCQKPAANGCTYPEGFSFNSSAYEVQSAFCKQQQNWLKIKEDDTVGQFFDHIGTLPLILQDINLTFDHEGDEMPPNRLKIIHATGTVALFKFVSRGNHDFTGALKGTDFGILRISEVGSARKGETPATSMGLKFFRNGVASGNMFTVHAFEGHKETYNFLRRDIDYNTHVDIPTDDCRLMTSHAKLAQATDHIGNMSVKNISDYDQYGNRESSPKWPFMMRLLPNDPCNSPDEWQRPFTQQLTSGCIPSGTSLFDVMALAEPKELGGEEIQIGEIVTTSEMVTSIYGDTRLFFRH